MTREVSLISRGLLVGGLAWNVWNVGQPLMRALRHVATSRRRFPPPPCSIPFPPLRLLPPLSVRFSSPLFPSLAALCPLLAWWCSSLGAPSCLSRAWRGSSSSTHTTLG